MLLVEMEDQEAAAAVEQGQQAGPDRKAITADHLTQEALEPLVTVAVEVAQVPLGLLVALLETEGMGQHHLLQDPL